MKKYISPQIVITVLDNSDIITLSAVGDKIFSVTPTSKKAEATLGLNS
ncbi:MAG: hypothetical protein IJS61_05310 [Firmicutes bacterium]|nr:hypothetical protein [Bacillota bacterium]